MTILPEATACVAMWGCLPLPLSGSQGIASPATFNYMNSPTTAELFTVVKSSAVQSLRATHDCLMDWTAELLTTAKSSTAGSSGILSMLEIGAMADA